MGVHGRRLARRRANWQDSRNEHLSCPPDAASAPPRLDPASGASGSRAQRWRRPCDHQNQQAGGPM